MKIGMRQPPTETPFFLFGEQNISIFDKNVYIKIIFIIKSNCCRNVLKAKKSAGTNNLCPG